MLTKGTVTQERVSHDRDLQFDQLLCFVKLPLSRTLRKMFQCYVLACAYLTRKNELIGESSGKGLVHQLNKTITVCK